MFACTIQTCTLKARLDSIGLPEWWYLSYCACWHTWAQLPGNGAVISGYMLSQRRCQTLTVNSILFWLKRQVLNWDNQKKQLLWFATISVIIIEWVAPNWIALWDKQSCIELNWIELNYIELNGVSIENQMFLWLTFLSGFVGRASWLQTLLVFLWQPSLQCWRENCDFRGHTATARGIWTLIC